MAFSVPVEDVHIALGRADSERSATPAAGAQGWRPRIVLRVEGGGTSYVYGVRLSYDAGPDRVALEGTSIYRVTSATAKEATLSHRGHLVSRKRPRAGQGATQIAHVPSQPSQLSLDPKGHAAKEATGSPLPIVGDLAMLVIEPLPDKAPATWSISNSMSLGEVQSRPDAASPLPFGRPSMIPRHGVRPGPGGRFGPRFGPPGFGPPGFGPPGFEAAATSRSSSNPSRSSPTRPREKTTYTVDKSDAGAVVFRKTYALTSDEEAGGERMFQVTGEGTWKMDATQGVPKARSTMRPSSSSTRTT